jgi:hypothetical protein
VNSKVLLRDYETVGYVISGSAKLNLQGQTLNLKAGDSWLAEHEYKIVERSPLLRQRRHRPRFMAVTHRLDPGMGATKGKLVAEDWAADVKK